MSNVTVQYVDAESGKPCNWHPRAVRTVLEDVPYVPPTKSPDETRIDALKVRILAETATATEVREALKLLMKAGRL